MASESACLQKLEKRSSMLDVEKAERNSAHNRDDARFPKSNRLCSKKGISRLFQDGQFRSYSLLKFKYLRHEERETHFLISISKRVGNSPERNRIKRLIRESLRLSGRLTEFPMDCAVFINRPPKRKATLQDIQTAIDRFFASLSS